MYPHLTEIQKIYYFPSLLRGNALQAYWKLDDTKNDNLEDIITASKRSFGDFNPLPMQDANGMRYILTPPSKNFMNSSTHCKKLQKETFGSEAKKSLIKQYMPKCRITLKISSTGHTYKTTLHRYRSASWTRDATKRTRCAWRNDPSPT